MVLGSCPFLLLFYSLIYDISSFCKPVMSNIKFYFGIFCSFLLTVAVFLVGWGMSFSSVNLNNVSNAKGTITFVELEQNKGSKAYPGQMNLVIYVDNRKPGFWLYRASQNYSDLISALHVDDNVTVYYDENGGANGYMIYQLGNSKEVIYSKEEYEKKEKFAGRFIALPGSFIMLGILVFQVRKRFKVNASS
jgi:hypothetical protein